MKFTKDALFYKTYFEGRKFHLRAGKRGVLLEFDILFSAERFKHMIGLHKINDIAQVKYSSSKLYHQILNKELTISNISISKNYYSIKNRLIFFEELENILNSKELMIKSLHGKFNTIEADYLLSYKDNKYGYSHLFLKRINQEICVPVTFFIHNNNDYLRNNPDKWKVLSIEEIEKKRY